MLLITCPFWIASLLTTELKRLGIKPQDSFPNGCRVADDSRETIIRINLHSRIANKVFLEMTQDIVTSFEELFQLTQTIHWAQHIQPSQAFRVLATTKNSMLHAERTVQSITHKAIVTQLTWSDDAQWETNDTLPQLDMYVYLQNNIAHIMKNTSGDSLHRRARRVTQGDAPIKENLAVATLLSASRPFSQALWDPCCGSGTLLIEAARLAKNIVPGRDRKFAFESFPDFPEKLFHQILDQAHAKEMTKSRTIIWSDIDEDMLEKAKINAKEAGVDDIIQFVYHDIRQENKHPALQWPTTVICNPPYGQRMQDYEIKTIHDRLSELITQPWRNGAIISGYEEAATSFPAKTWKRKETRQGKERCYIYIAKGKKS